MCRSVSEETQAFTHVQLVYTEQEEKVVRFLYPCPGIFLHERRSEPGPRTVAASGRTAARSFPA
ncbi:hypothetical protein NSPZN2_10088 [Nitrospira defluvii]|uniref:Uncharacterized protein n=1 Tax=Nitrospira defluvii TaxID=330214 RepID=A0ABN7KE97_9BACT|nr:hypothetical protein NSPZN2_10088 [Nitrospira defluvii]